MKFWKPSKNIYTVKIKIREIPANSCYFQNCVNRSWIIFESQRFQLELWGSEQPRYISGSPTWRPRVGFSYWLHPDLMMQLTDQINNTNLVNPHPANGGQRVGVMCNGGTSISKAVPGFPLTTCIRSMDITFPLNLPPWNHDKGTK